MKGYSSFPRVESMTLPLDQRPGPEWSCCRTDKKAGVRYWWRLVRHGYGKLPKEAMTPTDQWVPAFDKPVQRNT